MTIKNKYWQHSIVLLIYCVFITLLTWPLISNLRTTLFGDYGDTRGAVYSIWHYINSPFLQSKGQLIAAPFEMLKSPLAAQSPLAFVLKISALFIGEIPSYNLLILVSFPLTAFATYLFLNYFLQNKIAAFTGGLIFGFCPAAVMQAVGGHVDFFCNMFVPLFLFALFYNREKRNLPAAFFVGSSYALLTLNNPYFGYFAIFIMLFFVVFDYGTQKQALGSRLRALRKKTEDGAQALGSRLQAIGKKRALGAGLQAPGKRGEEGERPMAGGEGDRTANGEWRKGFFMNYSAAVFFIFALIVLFEYRMILHYLTTSRVQLVEVGLMRSFENLVVYSARPWEYLLPSIDHPVLGRFIISFSRSHLHWSNFFEQTLYIGLVPIALCVIGLFRLSRNYDGKQRRYFTFFILGVLLMIFLSGPPFIPIGANRMIPLVSYFMYKIAPMFRVYSRFGILANVFMACAAAVALAELSQKMTKIRYYLLLAVFLPVLIFEYWSIPPYQAHAIDSPPAVYQWLAREPGDFIIAEYPMMEYDEAAFYTYLFWQRIHQKRMVNGAGPENPKAWDFYQKVNDLSTPDTPRLLKSVGVKYIIVHKQMYREGEIPEPLKRYYSPEVSARQYNNGIVPVNPLLKKPDKIFGDDMVYSLDN